MNPHYNTRPCPDVLFAIEKGMNDVICNIELYIEVQKLFRGSTSDENCGATGLQLSAYIAIWTSPSG